MDFVIEKNIPIPRSRANIKTGAMDAIRKMAIGDSVLCPKTSRANFQNMAKRAGMKLVGRTADDQTVRFWRVE